MDQVLIAVLIIGLLLIVLPIWVVVRIVGLGRENRALAGKLAELERELIILRRQRPSEPSASVPSEPRPAPSHPLVAPGLPAVSAAPTPPGFPAEPAPQPQAPRVTPPPLPAGIAAAAMSTAPTESPTPAPLRGMPAPSGDFAPTAAVPRAGAPHAVNWEQFMGAKGFAWIGGFAAFLAAAFFVKYSFEHDLIPPQVRVAIGFIFAIGLVIGGLKVPRERYAPTAQTLIATGIVSLYAVTFACNSIYHFAFFGPIASFLVMSLITATAFLLAVRLDARVIAILGILGGFLTPVLLSTGHDNPPGLFGYLALLDIGLIAVALHRRWHFLVPLGAAGTVLMQVAWAAKFFTDEKAGIAIIVGLGFAVLFLGAALTARRRGHSSPELALSAAALAFVCFGFALYFIAWTGLGGRPGLIFTFAMLADACLLALAWFDEQLPRVHLAGGIAVFALLSIWSASELTSALLPWALAFYLVYAVLHTAFPLMLQRYRPDASPTWWSQLFPPLTLVLMMLPLVKLDVVSFAIWPVVLLVDALAVLVALMTASLTAVAAVLFLTAAATALWIFRVPVALAPEPELLLVIGGVGVLFFAATLFLGQRIVTAGAQREDPLARLFGDARTQIPAFSALLPFILLVMMTQRLSLADPLPVFGLALLLVVLTLGLAYVMTIEWLPACALAGVAALEYAWQARHFSPQNAVLPLWWYIGFDVAFLAFPFVPWPGRPARDGRGETPLGRTGKMPVSRFQSLTGPWAVSALAGVVQFPLVYDVVRKAWPNDFLGVIPAVFAIPPLISLVAVLRGGAEGKPRLNQLAWFGGVALLFITLVFPIQFERQWLTLAWALEGAALLWLFHRVPHPGLRATGVVLLVTSFVRLALNPAVLEYHARSQTPLLNWYLYSYGIVATALLIGARLIAAPRHLVFGMNARPLLATLGTAMTFLLLNIEIADFFSAPGTRVLTFQFSGNFARDMTYTIAWALFALALLLVSMARGLRAGRYSALALLGVAVLKLFFHDLARLDSLYRIGALFAVAVIALVASVAYQRFLPSDEKPVPPDR
jgi:uncharacterized membrane protein